MIWLIGYLVLVLLNWGILLSNDEVAKNPVPYFFASLFWPIIWVTMTGLFIGDRLGGNK